MFQENNLAVSQVLLNPSGLNGKPLVGTATSFLAMGEIWKDVAVYNDYEVSNFGRVRSKRRNGKWGRILKAGTTKKGYLMVVLHCCKGKGDSKVIHRLVLDAFYPNIHSLPQVNHKDGNKQNNRIENLEWCTDAYNKQHAYDNGLYPLKHKIPKVECAVCNKMIGKNMYKRHQQASHKITTIDGKPSVRGRIEY